MASINADDSDLELSRTPFLDEVDEKEGGSEEVAGSGFVGAVSNLANAAVGAGILAFPLAMASCGWVLGILVTLGFSVLMGYTLHILGLAAGQVQGTSYQDVVVKLLGKRAGLVIKVIMSLYLYGACIAYTNIVADQLTEVVSNTPSLTGSILSHRTFLVPVTTVVIIAPLCFLRHIEFLQYTSLLAVISVVYLELDVIIHAAKYLHEHGGPAPGVTAFRWSGDIFASFPLIAFAFNCHLVYVPVFDGLKTSLKSAATMDRVTAITYLICNLLYVPTGILGYMQFGPNVNGDILLGDLPFTPDVNAARVCVALTAVFSYPLLHYVARTAINDLTFGVDLKDPTHWRHYILLTTLFLLATAAVSTFVTQLGTVLSVTGSTAAVVQVFIYPAWMLLEMNQWNTRSRVIATALVIFGLAMCALSLWATFRTTK